MSDLCKVCGQLSHGIHFGVASCRACAAFFRRMAKSKWSEIKCQSRLCNGENYHCKPCRVKKCWAVGMDPSKFQTDKTALLISRKRKLPPSFEYLIGRPHLVLFTDSESQENFNSKKTYVDFTQVIGKVSKIMKFGVESPLIAENSLKKMGLGLSSLFLMREKPEKTDLVTRSQTTSFWEWYLVTVARWLVHFDKFQELEPDIKMQILFSVWHVWGRLYKLFATALYRKQNQHAKSSERIVGSGLLTDFSTVRSETEWLSDYSQEQVNYFLAGIRNIDLFHMTDELQNLNISELEMNFMLAQLSFQYVNSKFKGTRVEELMEEFLDVLTDNLHDYYVKDRNMANYSGRLMQMLRFNGKIQENIRKNQNRVELAKLFHVFKLEFSHPEMFEDTGYG